MQKFQVNLRFYEYVNFLTLKYKKVKTQHSHATLSAKLRTRNHRVNPAVPEELKTGR